MLDLLRTIILDFQESVPAVGHPRRLKLEPIPGKATVVIGVRRSGKSTLLFQTIERLVARGVSRSNILYVNFFDDRLHELARTGPGAVIDAYFALFPEKKDVETIYCFFDEIQAVPGWEPFVDRLLRTERCEVYLTGSSARMLSKEVATQMRGRALAWELFPFSFREFLAARGVDASPPWSTRRRLTIRAAFGDFWECGGFPEVIGLDRRLRVRIHQEYFQAVLFRDLIDRHQISNTGALSDLVHGLVDNAASPYTINRLTGTLKSLGHRTAKISVTDYLDWLEDAYFLFSVSVFDASTARRRANPKKIYCVDHAMVASVSSGILINAGHLLENLVFTALRRVTDAVWYYKTKMGREVDFLAQWPDRTRRLIQVCESLAHPETRRRETNALVDAMAEQRMTEGTIVTRDESDDIEVDGRAIHVVPVWRFLLEPSLDV